MKSRSLLLLVLALALLLPAGCKSEQAILQERYGPSLLEMSRAGLDGAGLTEIWSQDLAQGPKGKREKVTVTRVYLYPLPLQTGQADNAASVARPQGAVLVTTATNALYCFDWNTGQIQWVTVTPEPLKVAPVLVDNAYYAVIGRQLLTVSAKGEITVGGHLPTSVVRPLLVLGEYIFAVGSDGAVYKVDKTNLAQVWASPARTDSVIMNAPELLAGMLVFGTVGGELIGVDRVIGGRRLDVRGFGAIPGVATDGRMVYFGSADYHEYCYSSFGSEVWNTVVEGQVARAPVLANDVVYQDVMGRGLVALDIKSGAILWKNPEAEGFLSTDGECVIATGVLGQLLVIDAADGATKSRFDATQYCIAPVNPVGDGAVVLASRDGRVVCLKAK